MQTFDIGGWHITEHMLKLLTEKRYFRKKSISKVIIKEVANDVKEKLGYVAKNYKKSMKKAEDSIKSREFEINYEVPDGQIITVGHERLEAPEIMFKPYLSGKTGQLNAF